VGAVGWVLSKTGYMRMVQSSEILVALSAASDWMVSWDLAEDRPDAIHFPWKALSDNGFYVALPKQSPS